jgi:hypothetical protein
MGILGRSRQEAGVMQTATVILGVRTKWQPI